MADFFTRLAGRLHGYLDGVLLPNLPSRFAPPPEILDDGPRAPAAPPRPAITSPSADPLRRNADPFPPSAIPLRPSPYPAGPRSPTVSPQSPAPPAPAADALPISVAPGSASPRPTYVVPDSPGRRPAQRRPERPAGREAQTGRALARRPAAQVAPPHGEAPLPSSPAPPPKPDASTPATTQAESALAPSSPEPPPIQSTRVGRAGTHRRANRRSPPADDAFAETSTLTPPTAFDQRPTPAPCAAPNRRPTPDPKPNSPAAAVRISTVDRSAPGGRAPASGPFPATNGGHDVPRSPTQTTAYAADPSAVQPRGLANRAPAPGAASQPQAAVAGGSTEIAVEVGPIRIVDPYERPRRRSPQRNMTLDAYLQSRG